MTLAPVPEDQTVDLIPARADTDSWTVMVAEVAQLADTIAETSFVPRGLRGNAAATAAAILYGREVGLPPMTALSQINVVDGRPALSAEAMRALVLAAGHEVVFDETTSAVCRVRGRRLKSNTWTPVEWTIDLARKAGLLRRGSGWEFYPREMLIARATTALCRLVFPDVIHGFRSVEELDDQTEPVTPEPSPRGNRASVSRRPKAAAPEPEPGGTGPVVPEHAATESGPAAPPPHRSPSLPGEEEETGGAALGVSAAPPPPPPVPPRHAGQPEAVEDRPDDAPPLVNRATLKLVFGQLRRLGLGDDAQGRDARLRLLAQLANRSDLATANDLTQDEGAQIVTILSTFRDRDALDEFLAIHSAATIADPIEDDPDGAGEEEA